MPTVLDSLNSSLLKCMQKNTQVFLLGEDILDPYGGAFKVTKGLSTKFPERVLTTPVSEAGIVGIAGGMALRGLRPVVEIMFGDFITLAADQIINSLSKFPWMYNEQVDVPITIRTPMGGRRGYGPTHSQSVEKLFLGVPGINIFAATALGNPGELLSDAILSSNIPSIFIENKLLYATQLFEESSQNEFSLASSLDEGQQGPTYRLNIVGAPPPQITLTSYGYMAEVAKEAMLKLAYEHEIFCELIVPSQILPFPTDALFASLSKTQRLLAIEEGTLTHGWGAEILALASEEFDDQLKASARVAAKNLPIPASIPLENEILPQLEDIVEAAKKMV